MRTRLRHDTGGIVVGWLVRLVAVFAVVGVLVFDGVSWGVAGLAVTDSAAAASREASTVLAGGGTPQQAYDAALDAVTSDGATDEVPVESFRLTPEGSVTLTVRRTTPTLVLHHLPGSARWLLAESTATHTVG